MINLNDAINKSIEKFQASIDFYNNTEFSWDSNLIDKDNSKVLKNPNKVSWNSEWSESHIKNEYIDNDGNSKVPEIYTRLKNTFNYKTAEEGFWNPKYWEHIGYQYAEFWKEVGIDSLRLLSTLAFGGLWNDKVLEKTVANATKIGENVAKNFNSENIDDTLSKGLTELLVTAPANIMMSLVNAMSPLDKSNGDKFKNYPKSIDYNFLFDTYYTASAEAREGTTFSMKANELSTLSRKGTQKSFYNPVEVLIADIPDFQKNMFSAFIKVRGFSQSKGINLNGEFVDRNNEKEDYFALRLKNLNIPKKYSNTETLNFQNVVINKVGSEVKFDRKISLTFKLDEGLYVLRTLSAWSSDFSKNYSNEKITDKQAVSNLFTNLYNYRRKQTVGERSEEYDDKIDIIIRIDNNDYEDENIKNHFVEKYGYPRKVIYYRLVDCRFLGISNNISASHSNTSPVEIQTTVTFKNVEKLVGNKTTYNYFDSPYEDTKEFVNDRGMIAEETLLEDIGEKQVAHTKSMIDKYKYYYNPASDTIKLSEYLVSMNRKLNIEMAEALATLEEESMIKLDTDFGNDFTRLNEMAENGLGQLGFGL